jgi:hypothetical protein
MSCKKACCYECKRKYKGPVPDGAIKYILDYKIKHEVQSNTFSALSREKNRYNPVATVRTPKIIRDGCVPTRHGAVAGGHIPVKSIGSKMVKMPRPIAWMPTAFLEFLPGKAINVRPETMTRAPTPISARAVYQQDICELDSSSMFIAPSCISPDMPPGFASQIGNIYHGATMIKRPRIIRNPATIRFRFELFKVIFLSSFFWVDCLCKK